MIKKHLVSLLTITLVMALTCVFSEADEGLAVAGKTRVECDGTYSCTASISLVDIIAGTLDQAKNKKELEEMIFYECDDIGFVLGDIFAFNDCIRTDSTIDGLESWFCKLIQGCLDGQDVTPCDPPYVNCSDDDDYTVADSEALDFMSIMMLDMT